MGFRLNVAEYGLQSRPGNSLHRSDKSEGRYYHLTCKLQRVRSHHQAKCCIGRADCMLNFKESSEFVFKFSEQRSIIVVILPFKNASASRFVALPRGKIQLTNRQRLVK